jgi:C1A family cysteine protease
MWGCQGGLLPPAWEFIMDNGIMTYADYPYTSGTSETEGKCKHDESKTIATRPKSIHMYTPNNTVSEMKAIWMQQPVSVSLDASRSTFQLYKSGVIPADNNCGEQLNHAIVGVGYSDTDNGPSPNPGPNPDPNPPNPTPVGNCKVKKWWHTCEDAPARRNLQHYGQLDNYWLMQNQWGTGWGDQGFIRIEISGGKGACGMNKELEWAEI